MNADDELRLSYLRRAWEPIEEWDRTADPSCPCKGLVAPYLAGWREFLAEPDAMGVDEQERAALAARNVITKYARPDSFGELFREHVQHMADVIACEAGDPRCAPLPSPASIDPAMGAAPPASGDASDSNPIGALGKLFGAAASSVATPAATDAGKAAGDAAGAAAATQIAAAAPAVAAALKQELPGLASAARDAVAPLVTPIAQQAGAEAGKAAVAAAKQEAGGAGSLTPVVVVGGIGVAGLLAWWLLRSKKGK